MRLLLCACLLSGCSILDYDGLATGAEYQHNWYRPAGGTTVEGVGAHVRAGPVFDIAEQDNLELTLAVGAEARGPDDDDLEPSLLLNPRIMWLFEPKGFVQIEVDTSIMEAGEQNTFLFFQFEKRW